MIPLICHLTNSRQLSCPQELYQVPEKELCRLRPEGKMAIPRIRVVTIPRFHIYFPHNNTHPTKMDQMKIQKDYNQLLRQWVLRCLLRKSCYLGIYKCFITLACFIFPINRACRKYFYVLIHEFTLRIACIITISTIKNSL